MSKFFKKHFKKFVSFISILCVTSLFCINAFAADAWYNVNRPANAAKLVAESSGDNIISSLILDPDLEGWYNFDNAQTFLNDGFRLRFNDTSWKVVLEHDAFDYYLSIMLLSKDSAHDFPCNDIVLRESDGNSYKSTVCENFRSDSYDGIRNGVRFFGDLYTCKVPESFSGDFWVIYFDLLNPQTGVLGSNCLISINLFQVQKNTSAEDVQSIINAINQQTVTIDDSINNQTDVIINGTDDTDDTVSDFDEVFDDFNDKIAEWEEFDDDIISEWDDANSEYQTQLSDFNLSTSLLKAGNWLSTSMQNIYDNSSDYKMLWLVPLLFGIPILLFVISKGRDE